MKGILGFFKTKGIHYRILDKKSTLFQCVYCSSEGTIEHKSAKWKCFTCERDGTLVTLIKALEEPSFSPNQIEEFIDPRKLKRKIKRRFKSLLDRTDDIHLSRCIKFIQSDFDKFCKKIEELN